MTTYGKKADKFEVYRAIYNAPAGTSMRDIANPFNLTKARVSQIKKEIEYRINANDQSTINKLKDLGITLDAIAAHKVEEKKPIETPPTPGIPPAQIGGIQITTPEVSGITPEAKPGEKVIKVMTPEQRKALEEFKGMGKEAWGEFIGGSLDIIFAKQKVPQCTKQEKERVGQAADLLVKYYMTVYVEHLPLLIFAVSLGSIAIPRLSTAMQKKKGITEEKEKIPEEKVKAEVEAARAYAGKKLPGIRHKKRR